MLLFRSVYNDIAERRLDRIPYDSIDKKCIPYYGPNIITIPHYILFV